MKASIDVPDELYRKIEAKSAQQGRTLGAVAVELLQRWLDEDGPGLERAVEGCPDGGGAEVQIPGRSAQSWLEEAFRLADDAAKHAPPGPSAREILEQDRNRLERR